MTKDALILSLSDRVFAQAELLARRAERKNMAEKVDHPPHYGGDTTYETIKVIEAWGLDFCLGNAVKYLSRAGKKGDELEDLRKAAWYIQRRIEQLNQKESCPPLVPIAKHP